MSALIPKADVMDYQSAAMWRVGGTFWFRQELCRTLSIVKLVKLMPFSSLVGLPMFSLRYFGCPC